MNASEKGPNQWETKSHFPDTLWVGLEWGEVPEGEAAGDTAVAHGGRWLGPSGPFLSPSGRATPCGTGVSSVLFRKSACPALSTRRRCLVSQEISSSTRRLGTFRAFPCTCEVTSRVFAGARALAPGDPAEELVLSPRLGDGAVVAVEGPSAFPPFSRAS